MTDQSLRPKFLPSFLEEVRKEAEERNWLAVFPYGLIACALLSAGVAYVVPVSFWADEHWGISTAVYSGLLTFNGLILALGWTAFGRIYDILTRGDFGKYLMNTRLLNPYIVHMTYMHIFQIVAIVVSGLGLVEILVEGTPAWLDRIVFAATIAFTAYSIKQAVGAVTAMNDLIWQAAYYEANKPDADKKVVPIGGAGG